MLLEKIDVLRQFADDHFGHDPAAIHKGHVGDLGRIDWVLDDQQAIFDGQAKPGLGLTYVCRAIARSNDCLYKLA